MKVLLTIKEYAKVEGLSEIGARKRVSSRYIKSIILDSITYVIHEDKRLEIAKQSIKDKNAIIRELKLKNELHNGKNINEDKVIQLLNKQVKYFKKDIKKKDKKIDKLSDKKDGLYEEFISSMLNYNKKINYKE